jgi:hypothetical protein
LPAKAPEPTLQVIATNNGTKLPPTSEIPPIYKGNMPKRKKILPVGSLAHADKWASSKLLSRANSI